MDQTELITLKKIECFFFPFKGSVKVPSLTSGASVVVFYFIKRCVEFCCLNGRSCDSTSSLVKTGRSGKKINKSLLQV